mgnify:CR=1 FL=1
MAYSDQFPDAYAAWLAAAGGAGKVVEDAFAAWAYANGVIAAARAEMAWMADRTSGATNEFLRASINARFSA